MQRTHDRFRFTSFSNVQCCQVSDFIEGTLRNDIRSKFTDFSSFSWSLVWILAIQDVAVSFAWPASSVRQEGVAHKGQCQNALRR